MTAPTAQVASQALTDAELDRLEELLADPALEDALRLDEVQGYLCAALSGPRPMPPERWLADVLGDDDALEQPVGLEAAGLLRRFADALEAELNDGEAPTLLLYPIDEGEDAPSDYQPWCEAYLAAIDTAEEDWFDFLGENESDESEESEEIREEITYLDERLFPLMVLTGEAESAAREHGEAWPEGKEREQLLADCEEDLPQAVADIHNFWRAKRSVGTIRRESPKVGRNDPCPCGSGKKYKQCCGSE